MGCSMCIGQLALVLDAGLDTVVNLSGKEGWYRYLIEPTLVLKFNGSACYTEFEWAPMMQDGPCKPETRIRN